MIAIFEQYRIGPRVYSDGGLLGALPLWAPAEMGADRIIAINALPKLPSAAIRSGVKALRFAVRYRPPRLPERVEVQEIRPEGALGSVRESLVWTEQNVRRWIAQGRADARGWLERQA
jgi:predicted acylesterase/phospholipase RssA